MIENAIVIAKPYGEAEIADAIERLLVERTKKTQFRLELEARLFRSFSGAARAYVR